MTVFLEPFASVYEDRSLRSGFEAYAAALRLWPYLRMPRLGLQRNCVGGGGPAVCWSRSR
jgi:hypothetical protein